MTLKSIKYENGKLEILDQLLLPDVTKYIPVLGVETGWQVINKMQVRGAPAIAIVGCLSLAVELRKEVFDSKKVLRQEVEGKLNYLVSARPTAVNMKMATEELITLVNLIDKDDAVKPEEMKAKFIAAIEAMLEKDVADNRAIGDAGARAILSHAPDDYLTRVLTHCNTGSLATAGYGTALGVIRNLHTRKRLGDHARDHYFMSMCTALRHGHTIKVQLVCDSMVAALMRSRNISSVVVGADRVAANGDTANKIGTYQNISDEKFTQLFEALPENTHLETLSLTNTGMTDPLALKLADALEHNNTLRVVNVETNFISPLVIVRLIKSLLATTSIEEFRASNQANLADRPKGRAHNHQKHPSNDIPRTTQYYEGLDKLRFILTSSPLAQNILNSTPRTTFKCPPNLQNILAHHKLSDPATNNNKQHQAKGSYTCNKHRQAKGSYPCNKHHQAKGSYPCNKHHQAKRFLHL
uniref:Uncharacterized protein n=1 Tax=Timema tahoe TaxID=61484 RepID=A0A7R9IQL4_9NEOP|nr:unnamed protein product [Timema tahoe]